jgi:hypothetical protein
MNLTAVKNVVTSSLGRKLLLTQKHSPVLLVGLGISGFVGTVVLAVKASLKMEGIVKDTEDKLAAIDSDESLSESDQKKARKKVQVQTFVKICKLYAPTFGVGIVSIGALTGGHIIQFRRLSGLSAAYAAVDQGFREYRKRVVNELGADKDAEYRYGLVEQEIFVREDENGKPIIEKMMRVNPDAKMEMYAKRFEKGNVNWSDRRQDNQTFISAQQNYANERLESQGYLFLSDVYVALGFKETSASRLVGWVKGHPNSDGHVDFGLFSKDTFAGIQFINGETSSIVLDFNVDGEVWHLLED